MGRLKRMMSELAVSALRMAIQRRISTGRTVHSDRGSRFRSRRFHAELDRNGLVRFHRSSRQKNVLNSPRWATRADLRLAIVTWFEGPITGAGNVSSAC